MPINCGEMLPPAGHFSELQRAAGLVPGLGKWKLAPFPQPPPPWSRKSWGNRSWSQVGMLLFLLFLLLMRQQ